VVYVPSDYTDENDWPAIFFFNGVGGGPSTRLFKSITEGKGFIIIGIEYVETGTDKMTKGQYINNLKRELKSISKIQKHASKYFRIDKKRLFLTGLSRGGWHTAALIEQSAKPWAGAAIIAAGRRRILSPTTDSRNLLRDKPIYIGAGEKDPNMDAAKRAREYYRRLGADVTFEEYKGLGHMFKADSKILHDWLIINSAVEHTESARANKQQKAD
jgi:predicted peptidase